MRELIFSVAVGALAVSGMALADNPNWSAAKKAEVAANRCTDAGRGNGGELSVFIYPSEESFCWDGIDSDDQTVNIDAKDPLVIPPPPYGGLFSIATDPGHSAKKK